MEQGLDAPVPQVQDPCFHPCGAERDSTTNYVSLGLDGEKRVGREEVRAWFAQPKGGVRKRKREIADGCVGCNK